VEVRESTGKQVLRKHQGSIEQLKHLPLRQKGSKNLNYGDNQYKESVSVVLGHEIGTKAIRILIASGGKA